MFPRKCSVRRHWRLVAFERAIARRPPSSLSDAWLSRSALEQQLCFRREMRHVDGDQLLSLAINRLNKFHLPKLHKAKPEVNLCLTSVFVETKQ